MFVCREYIPHPRSSIIAWCPWRIKRGRCRRSSYSTKDILARYWTNGGVLELDRDIRWADSCMIGAITTKECLCSIEVSIRASASCRGEFSGRVSCPPRHHNLGGYWSSGQIQDMPLGALVQRVQGRTVSPSESLNVLCEAHSGLPQQWHPRLWHRARHGSVRGIGVTLRAGTHAHGWSPSEIADIKTGIARLSRR